MIVLAMHTMGHDTGVAIFNDGALAFALETERLTRLRHDHNIAATLDHLWEATDLRPEQIDLLVFSTNVRNTIAQIDDFEAHHRAIEGGQLHALSRSSLLGHSLPCLIVAHEASHAALACHYAGWADNTLVLVNEGRGTFSRNSCFVYRDQTLTLVERDGLPWYGTGFGWSALGFMLGLGDSPSAAGTAMALGGYGAFSNEAAALLRSIDSAFHNTPREAQRPQAQPLLNYLEANPGFAERASLMATFQELFCSAVVTYCQRQLAAHGCDRLGLGGGCALNLPTNSALQRDLATPIAIPPNCNDSGQAIGAALYALAFYLGIRPHPYAIDNCGLPLSNAEAEEALARAGLRSAPLDLPILARRLADGAVVAFAQGRSELGPRALGNRSLLASACRPGMRKKLSEELKQRQWYRPLACVMREERFAQHYPDERPSPYMLYHYPMPDGLAPEATHADGSSRIQTLDRAANPALWDLLREYERQTGEASLINTSLNGPGKPIAYRAQDILDDFLDRAVDVFVFNDLMAFRD